MDYTPITPFRRTLSPGQMQQALGADMPAPTPSLAPSGVNKWEVLRELTVARVEFGLSDRDIAVLQALLSFRPGAILGGNSDDMVVHPSNRAICERLGGMPCSTMRRHLGNLVNSGLVVRRDSPNGKRYARTDGQGKVVFGFDLTPLAARHADICEAAEFIRAAQDRYKRLREAVSLMRRDLAGLAAWGLEMRPEAPLWPSLTLLAADTARALRRKLEMDDLMAMRDALQSALNTARGVLEHGEKQNMSTNDACSGQHYQNSNTNLYDSELSIENAKVEIAPNNTQGGGDGDDPSLEPDQNLPNVPLGMVLACCHEIKSYGDGPLRHWHEFVRAADMLCPMMGISPSAWNDAKQAMGPEQAAVVLAAMLERFAEIKSPGGYLRHLTHKAQNNSFSCGPMVMALLRKQAV